MARRLAALFLTSLTLPLGAEEPPLPTGLAPATRPAGEDEPPLPAGLGEEDEPELPAGLGEGGEPELPSGLEGKPAATKPAPKQTPAAPEAFKWADVTGFWEVRGGVRTQHDPHERKAPLGESRLQIELEKRWKGLTFNLTADLLYDAVVGHHTPRLETGDGLLDLREANVLFSPLSFMDLKVGRQVLTWGTGDLIFINDLFPKDWRSFLIGRDVEYLKAPSDALKISLFGDAANVDVVFVPAFDPDRFIRGRRLSYYSGALGRLAGRDAFVDARVPDEWFDDHEWAVRVFRNLAGYELAAYGYWGFWKSPAGQDAATGDATFPRLSVYGASVRGQVGRGIGNLEVGYYDSRQDRSGDDPLVANSQVRLLAGYEQDLPEIASDLTVGVQYYLEWMEQYDDYLRALPAGSPAADELRHVVTFRIRKLLMNQNLSLSLFAYCSPSDGDAYLRPKISYKIDDHWTVEAGGNVFVGKDTHTFFGQFRSNSNVYAALRYGF